MLSDQEFPAFSSSSAAAMRVGKDVEPFSAPRPVANRRIPQLANASFCAPKGATSNRPVNVDRNSNISSGAGKGGNGNNKPRKKIFQAIDTNMFDVKKQLTASNIQTFAVKKTNPKGPVKITISNSEEVPATQATPANARVSYHEFKWSNERQKCFIIRGLVDASDSDLPFIKQELVDAGLPEDIVVSSHVTGHMRAQPGVKRNAPVKLVVPPNFDDKSLLQLRFLNQVAVRFELFKFKSVVQCKNCQRFGHTAGGCQHPHRCVRCSLNHLRNICRRTTNLHVKLRCCNCGGEHTSNYLSHCAFFRQHIESKQRQSPKTPAPVLKKPSPAPRQAGHSFAKVADGFTSHCSSGTSGSPPYSPHFGFLGVVLSAVRLLAISSSLKNSSI